MFIKHSVGVLVLLKRDSNKGTIFQIKRRRIRISLNSKRKGGNLNENVCKQAKENLTIILQCVVYFNINKLTWNIYLTQIN